MQTVASYDKAFETSKSKLVKMKIPKEDRTRLAVILKRSFVSIDNYCEGKGTNLKTYLQILEAAQSIKQS